MALVRKPNSPFWYIVFREGGKQVWRSTKCEVKADAEAIEARMSENRKKAARERRIRELIGEPEESPVVAVIKRQRTEAFQQIAAPPPSPSLADAWAKFRLLKPDANPTALKHWGLFSKWAATRPGVANLGDVTVTVAMDYLLDNYGEAAGKSYNNARSGLSAIWRVFGVMGAENVWLKIPNRENDPTSYRAFTNDEVSRIIAAATGFWRPAIITAVHTGLRKIDVMHLRRDEVFPDGHAEVMPKKTKKHGRAVFIHLHREVIEALGSIPNQGVYYFPEAVKQYDTGSFNLYFSTLLAGLGIGDTADGKASFHSLRATFITRCEESGVDRRVIQGIVGHKSPMMTEHYSQDHKSGQVITGLDSYMK